MNAREQLLAVAEWLAWQDESLSFGLRNALDGLRLYDYAQAHPNLPEMADAWRPAQRKAALDGYMRELSGSDRARGATDGDLPHLFAGLDAHMLRVAKRFNDPHSQEVGSACLSIDLA